MSLRPVPIRTLVAHASREAFVDKTWSILTRLGYRILTPDEFASLGESDPAERADLRIVDERRLGELSEEAGEEPVPIIVLSGRAGVTGADPRIVGAVKRPAGLHDLFRLVQQVLEDTPRTTPRVHTQLGAKCSSGDRIWDARVLSLSENGCLLRTPQSVQLGSTINLRFALPRSGEIEVRAEASYQLLPDFGFVFSSIAPAARDAIVEFVSDTLLAA